jgi:hypothetical protein
MIVTGKLVNVSDRFFFFVGDDGTEYALTFIGDPSGIPVEQQIVMALPDEPDERDRYVVDLDDGRPWTFATDLSVAGAPDGRIHIAVYWQVRPGDSDAKAMANAEKYAFELDRFYRHYSKGKWDLLVKPFLTHTRCHPKPPSYCISEIRKEVDTGDFKPTYHHVISYYYETGYCGVGNLGGDKSVTYLGSGGCNEHTTVHELGHNFGLRHANLPNEEYGDDGCVMGKGRHIPGLNSPHLLELGLEGHREKLTVNQTTQVLLCPIELDIHTLHDSETQHVIVEKDGNPKYYVSLRKDKGWPYNPKGDAHILAIHRYEGGKTVLVETMSHLGDNDRKLPNGVRLQYHEYQDETARITLDYDDGIVPDTLEIPTGLPDVLRGVETGEYHTGLWYNPDMNGQGFDIQVKNGRLLVYWYTFEQRRKERRFFWGTCDLTDGVEEFDLFTTTGGTFDDPKSAKAVRIGSAQLYFFGSDSGVFCCRTEEHGRRSVSIKPVATSDHPNSGLWYDPAYDGSGFSIQWMPHINKIIAYWYTHGPNRYSDRKQRWYMCDGDASDDADMIIYEVVGGEWLDYHSATVTPVGTANLKTIDTNTSVFSYDIRADGVSGTGTQNLKRLF